MTDAASYTVERSTTMQADPARVFEQVANFHHWRAWSPWEDIDPDMTRIFEGPESGVGAVYAWSGNRKAGEGRMEITRAERPTDVVIDLRFVKPFKSNSVTTFTIAPEGDGSRVTWTMVGPKTLATRAMGLFTSMDKMIGKDFEKGLGRLKTASESPAS